jgi:hypothetical protein
MPLECTSALNEWCALRIHAVERNGVPQADRGAKLVAPNGFARAGLFSRRDSASSFYDSLTRQSAQSAADSATVIKYRRLLSQFQPVAPANAPSLPRLKSRYCEQLAQEHRIHVKHLLRN